MAKYTEYDAEWMLTKEKLAPTNKAKIMHCLPVRRNVELSDEVLDSANSIVTQRRATGYGPPRQYSLKSFILKNRYGNASGHKKIGGNIIDNEGKLSSFLQDFASVKEAKILVHGGGKLATKLADQLGIPQQLVDGRRITDGETLKTVTMVYAGLINKNIVAQLQALGCNALGLTGADGNAIQGHKRIHLY